MTTQSDAPIAVVGMACLFPGAKDLDAFWRLLMEGGNAIREGIPGSGVGRLGELFPDPGVQNDACRFCAFVDDIDQFDAAFFRISPVEAELLDPQQRMMLETSWRALEDAGIDPDRLRGSRTGVYAGISNNEYRSLALAASESAEPAASLYAVSGTSLNTAIGRVAFALDFAGPALAVDTACSSSLVAIHQAVSGLQRGEADVALAGGVNSILSGRLLELRGNAGMLSPDGQCKTFDARANGYVRGEGCGIVVLKRLGDAEADGDRIWAVIRGSAVNQDGASPGITVPSGAAQEAVIAAALARAGIQSADVDYLEAHGTGTEVGDPIEVEAAANAYGKGRAADRPLLIGSVKTNIGHLESAAGAAGFIKAVLALKHRRIPKHLHFETPNPAMDWERLPLEVTASAMDWPGRDHGPPTASISGFGWSGTNVHMILAAHEADDGEHGLAGPVVSVATQQAAAGPARQRPARFLPLSAKSAQALRDTAGRYLDWLDGPAADPSAAALADIAWTASVGRSHFDHRAGIVFRDVESLRAGLTALAEAEDRPASKTAKRVAFAFTGQASQWVGMGRTLYEREPAFRAVLDQCDALLREERGASLLDVMFGVAGAADLDDPAWKQPAIYALECALLALWETLGVRPAVVFGHSLGEIAAARTAGVFSLEDGLRFAAARGSLIGALPGEGAMAAVFAPAPAVAEAVEAHNAGSADFDVSLAADNGAQQVVSGPVAEIEAITEHFESAGIRVRRLRKSPAYHSAMIDAALDPLEAALGQLEFAPPSIALISNLTGALVERGTVLGVAYWRRHARERVQFQACVETLAADGVDAVVEIGPHAVLGPMTTFAWPAAADGGPPPTVASLRQPRDEVPAEETEDAFVAATAAAYEAGIPIRLEGLFAGESRRRVPLPSYPFQHERFWVDTRRRHRDTSDHPLLGSRHESARGEVAFDTALFPDDPAWLADHRVFGRLIAPGALYGAFAAASAAGRDSEPVLIEDFQLQNPLVLLDDASDEVDASEEAVEAEGRHIQVLLDEHESARRVQVLSRGAGEGKGEADSEWTLHAEGRIRSASARPMAAATVDVASLKAALSGEDIAAYYRAKAALGIDLGPSFRTLVGLWSRPGEALGEVALPPGVDATGLVVHPLLLDGCFQVVGAARQADDDETTYLPFAWERLQIAAPWPERVFCHVLLEERPASADTAALVPEVVSGELRIYDANGRLIGELGGYTVKRATRASLLAAVEGIDELLYEVVWRESVAPLGIQDAEFLPSPSRLAADGMPFSDYLAAEDVDARLRPALLADLSLLARRYVHAALDALGWQRQAGAVVDAEDLRERLGVVPEHAQLFRRMLEILAAAGVLAAKDDAFAIVVGSDDPLPEAMRGDIEKAADAVAGRYPYAENEIGLFRRSAGALAAVLKGDEDPLALLFGAGEPSAADLYFKAPVWRAANKMLADTVQALVADLPDGRRLRVIEIGAGTGSATGSVLPELPEGRFDYTYTDISAGFFAEAESRFGNADGAIEYRVLDIEKDPVEQGFDHHGYDLLIASNVLHATRYLEETLDHCRELLAPSGELMALENLAGQDWLDLTFGQLDGWWRFADDFRPRYAVAGPDVWRSALSNVGFGEIEILGTQDTGGEELADRGVILAQGPAQVTERAGVWVLAQSAPQTVEIDEVRRTLEAANQTVVLADADGDRSSWHALAENLPADLPLHGVLNLTALSGCGPDASVAAMAADAKCVTAGALAMVQGLADADATPAKGLWFVTRGAQVLERERTGCLAGALQWGFGKVVGREMPHLKARLIDLDPADAAPAPDLLVELMHPDAETHIAYRRGARQVARLVRLSSEQPRLKLPEDPDWVVGVGEDGALDCLAVDRLPLAANEVRVAVAAVTLNFWDVFATLGLIDDGAVGGAGLSLGREMCGEVVEVGADVETVSVGDRVVGVRRGERGTFAPEVVTHEELVAPAPPGHAATALATIPTVFLSAAVSFEAVGLKAGDRVLVHAGAGGVGLAAIQLATAAGAHVLATASASKQSYVRSLGVEHVFDSRRTDFGREILEATDGAGVDFVLNSLTAEGFIEASLACLAEGGAFVELAARDILSEEEMARRRPDVRYAIVKLDVLKEDQPALVGRHLREIMRRVASGELTPLVYSHWPLAEAQDAVAYMRDGRHLGKIVLAAPPMAGGELRGDGTYLVTGGLGGIGCAVAEWLADHGAGTIVLNGRRDPDPDAAAAIEALVARGIDVRTELADVTDADAISNMLERIDEAMPPLAGVIHSVGALSDAAIGNQTWERFEAVLWPKVIGAWHLHRATVDRELELFVLFSSVAGVLGNPGQANHAAANAFLDQLAAHRRALGLPGQAIAWGAWSGIGEAEEQRERIAERLEGRGTGWITPSHGLKALERLVREDVTAATVLAADWTAYGQALEARPPFLDDLLAAADTDTAGATEDLMALLDAAPASDHEQVLASFLQREAQAVLRLPTAPEPAVGFFDLGMDSLMAVELRNRLNRAFGGAYTAANTVVFDYPDIATLARFLASELANVGTAPATPQSIAPTPPTLGSEDDGIAIVGMACRFPGAADLAAFWEQLERGGDAVTDRRQNADALGVLATDDADAGAAGYHRAGFMDDIDQFDARFFRIKPIEARSLDPQQRMLLETTWHALEDAAIDPDQLRGSRTGVYAGIGASEYRELLRLDPASMAYLGSAASMALGRISFLLGLEGPTLPVNLNCASSLVAVHNAVAGLRQGEVDMALVGGVSAVLSSAITAEMAELGMLSRVGRCNAFDQSADGFVRGEGCGMVVLKRLGDAEADGDRIWGVIRGSAVNQNGTAAGPTVPNGPAQERVIEQALARGGVAPSDVDYLEAHGAGSQLGDAIEAQAAAAVYGRDRAAEKPLLIGSVKTNVGHLEAAAGIAGLIKVVLAMQRGMVPKQLNFREPNTYVPWDTLPLHVTDTATPWPENDGRPRRAAVSAFGISGTNSHVVVDGADSSSEGGPAGTARHVPVAWPDGDQAGTADEALSSRKTRLLALSAKSDAALRQLAERYLVWLDDAGEGATPEALADMAWTAACGRSHFEHRRTIVFDDAPSLQAGLSTVAEARSDAAPGAAAVARVAFAYSGDTSDWIEACRALYAVEPIFRAVFDQCETLATDGERSLFELAVDGNSAWKAQATYAMQSALTMLWAGVGIRPDIVLGEGAGGAMAANRTAGVVGLQHGLRLAADPDDGELLPAATPMVSTLTGRVVRAGETPADDFRGRIGADQPSADALCGILAGLDIGAVIEIGPAYLGGRQDSLRTLAGLERDSNGDAAFVHSVARAYEAGLDISLTGLFAGEERRRIGLPGYPFERRSHWCATNPS